MKADPLWYKDAVIYELRVRSFNDSNGDGIGDFPGLTQKLDYLQDLGVTALWILPFYPSPGRDDGYDIADYTEVNPEYGRIEDFQGFLEAAHQRGLRVITELVINHTSDQHAWFQRARRAPLGSPEREFYVWSETPERYREARIIFRDFEASNWSWDPVAKAYYWHRFFSHQPDLNFRNPAVQQAVFSVCDFWLDLGVDGMRLDAVPYLYEEEGTNCENLPETHQFLKSLRAHIEAKYQDRMLLAEANQWPEDAAAYFGSGDECNMNFHFPIMPRIFMSIHMEDRLPLIDILAQTPAIPESCQWAFFLRNHDELTLEMVTDEERDYMYRAFAHDPAMRINLGIRRRLAPLLQNDRPNIELMNALLFSLPGTPVIYYGDEIGMGDNVYLGDRNGVRTPMQWSADRNAGFSRSNPQRLTLPLIIDPEYHYESVNAEAQQNNPHSLLWWTKRMIALRKRSQVFGRGSLEILQPDNQRVFSFLRVLGDERVLVVANLSRTVQYVELDLAKYKGLIPVELFGGQKLPPIGDSPYLLTLGGHGFYWLSLQRTSVTTQIARAASYQPLVLDPGVAPEELFANANWSALASLLPNYLEAQPWSHLPGRSIERASIVEVVDVSEDLRLVVTELRYLDSDAEIGILPLAIKRGEAAAAVRARSPAAVVAALQARVGEGASGEVLLVDVSADAASSRALLSLLSVAQRLRVGGGQVVVECVAPLPAAVDELDPRLPREPHETAILIYGDQLMLKLPRRVEEGLPPDLEITRFLAGRTPAAPVLRLISTAIYHPRIGEPRELAALHAYSPHDSDGWRLATAEATRFFERVVTRPSTEAAPQQTGDFWRRLQPVEVDLPTSEVVGLFQESARLLGQRLAELHLALASDASSSAFAPEPFGLLAQRSNYQSQRNLAGNVLRQLKGALAVLPESARPAGRQLLARSEQIYGILRSMMGARLTESRIRIHGSLDLHHLLHNGRDFTFIDFDGDRRRPLPERRRKRSPFRDLASLLASLHRVIFSALADETAVRAPDRALAERWADAWVEITGSALLQGYAAASAGAAFLPQSQFEQPLMLRCLLLERGLAELGDTLAEPSPQVEIPLRLLRQLLESSSADAQSSS